MILMSGMFYELVYLSVSIEIRFLFGNFNY
jgi:hypothetical protein